MPRSGEVGHVDAASLGEHCAVPAAVTPATIVCCMQQVGDAPSLSAVTETTMQKTLFEKIWDEHVVLGGDDGATLLYVDLHLVHEVTSPQAFEGLRLSRSRVRSARS